MDGLKILENQGVTNYLLSPDEKYIAFTYEDSCWRCDFGGSTIGLAVIGYDGKQFQDLGRSNAPHPLISLVAAWRPFSMEGDNP
jgi:hypothetical protein